MPPVRLLEVTGNAIVGGMERYVLNLVQELPAYGFEITCLAPFESTFTAALRAHGVPVLVTPMDNDPHWHSIQFATQLVKSTRVELIHAHLPPAHVLAGIVGRLTGRPVVTTIHALDIGTHELSVCRLTGTHLTVVCRESYLQAMALGLAPEQVTFIPNGVDARRYDPKTSGAPFRRQVGVPDDVPLVGLVGRLCWEKGPDLFLRAAGVVHRARPEAHFCLVGEGPLQDELGCLIHELGLEQCAHLVGIRTDMEKVYPALDLLVQSSRSEGMPLALLEGMACGRPVCAIGVGGVNEVVQVGVTGVIANPEDWPGLGKAVLRLLAEPARLRALGQAGRRRVEESFDLQNTIRLLANLLCDLAREKGERRNWALSGRLTAWEGASARGGVG